jgi:23S rRNA (cytidine1920-2'-O)/16S rRNA (cytidine1409-2'-O)-methyltransferase
MPSPTATRLDRALVERGLAPTRERARALILAGQVTVNGRPAQKAGDRIRPADEIALRKPDHPYVGRGGVKLAHALDVFRIEVAGRDALDVGASTGGFTDALLQRGAASVVALDVGHGQLDWTLRNDARVIVIERVNARSLTSDQLPAEHRAFDIVTVDVSFISLRYILPVIPPLLRPGADVIALIKPQFEAGREQVGAGGIVRDPDVQLRVVAEVSDTADRLGLRRLALVPSPIRGAEGNREFLGHFRRLGDLRI